ncbi:hypothetical protein [Actinokineospora sp. NPDC004072]
MDEKLPKTLRPVRALLYVQGALGILGNVALIALLADADVDGSGVYIALSVLGVVMAVVVIAAAAVLHRRPPWVRPAVLTVEGIMLVSAVVNLVTSLANEVFSPLLLVALVFPVVVLQAFLRQENKEWLAGGVSA